LTGVQSHDLELVWPEVKPFIERALEKAHGEYKSADIYNALHRKDMQLWIGGELLYVGVTQILTYPSGLKVVEIVLTAGDNLDQWVKDSNTYIEEWAKSLGADQIRVYGRHGWSKVLGKIGFNHGYTVMIRSIDK